MPQEFQVLQCYSCKTYQVHQVKKALKWACKMCGEKQSVIKVYGRGTGYECRCHVQRLNQARGENENLKDLSVERSIDDPEPCTEEVSLTSPDSISASSKWSTYTEEEQGQSDDDMSWTDIEIFTARPKRFQPQRGDKRRRPISETEGYGMQRSRQSNKHQGRSLNLSNPWGKLQGDNTNVTLSDRVPSPEYSVDSGGTLCDRVRSPEYSIGSGGSLCAKLPSPQNSVHSGRTFFGSPDHSDQRILRDENNSSHLFNMKLKMVPRENMNAKPSTTRNSRGTASKWSTFEEVEKNNGENFNENGNKIPMDNVKFVEENDEYSLLAAACSKDNDMISTKRKQNSEVTTSFNYSVDHDNKMMGVIPKSNKNLQDDIPVGHGTSKWGRFTSESDPSQEKGNNLESKIEQTNESCKATCIRTTEGSCFKFDMNNYLHNSKPIVHDEPTCHGDILTQMPACSNNMPLLTYNHLQRNVNFFNTEDLDDNDFELN